VAKDGYLSQGKTQRRTWVLGSASATLAAGNVGFGRRGSRTPASCGG
jgi:hypothetical protein